MPSFSADIGFQGTRIANALESVGQDVEQETPDELIGRQGHRFVLVAIPIVLPLERTWPFSMSSRRLLEMATR